LERTFHGPKVRWAKAGKTHSFKVNVTNIDPNRAAKGMAAAINIASNMGLFAALPIVKERHCGNAVNRAAKAQGTFQVTQIIFKSDISKRLHQTHGVSKPYQQNSKREPNSLLMSK